MLACGGDSIEIARLLILAGARVNGHDVVWLTAIYYCLSNR